MYRNIYHFISACRKSYNTQRVKLRLLEKWREKLRKTYVVRGVIMDISKAFDRVPHDLFFAKLTVYGVDESFLCYIYLYLLNGKKCVRVININSNFLNVTSGVPQGSIVGPTLFVSLMTFLHY